MSAIFVPAPKTGAITPGACLADAVSDALAPLGLTVNATPLTPEVVLRLIAGGSAVK